MTRRLEQLSFALLTVSLSSCCHCGEEAPVIRPPLADNAPPVPETTSPPAPRSPPYLCDLKEPGEIRFGSTQTGNGMPVGLQIEGVMADVVRARFVDEMTAWDLRIVSGQAGEPVAVTTFVITIRANRLSGGRYDADAWVDFGYTWEGGLIPMGAHGATSSKIKDPSPLTTNQLRCFVERNIPSTVHNFFHHMAFRGLVEKRG